MVAEAFPFELDVCSQCEQAYRRPDPRQVATMAVRPVLKVRWEVTIGPKKTMGTRRSAYQRYAWLKLRAAYKCDGSCNASTGYGPYGEETGGACPRGVCHPTRSDDEYGYTRNPPKGSVMYLQIRFVRWLVWHDAKLRGGKRIPKPKRCTVPQSSGGEAKPSDFK